MKTPPGNSLEELKDGDPLNTLKTVLGIEPNSAISAKTPLSPISNPVCSLEFRKRFWYHWRGVVTNGSDRCAL